MIYVRLVAPSPAMRAGLRSLLTSDDEIKVVDELNEWGDSLLEEQYEVDVVVTTSTSFAANPKDLSEAPSTEAVLFLRDGPSNMMQIPPAISVWGILPLDASGSELCAAVHALSQGLIVGTHSFLFPVNDYEGSARGPLTDREAEVLSLLAKGLANKQMALILGISEHTIKFHISSIYTKLNATNRTQAVREGLRNGWILL